MDSRLVVWFGILLLLRFDLTPDDILAYVILLGKVEKLANLGCTLGPKALGQNIIGEARKLFVSFLNNDKREDCNIMSDDATADRLAAPLALTPLTIA
jgi:hypothetical protein